MFNAKDANETNAISKQTSTVTALVLVLRMSVDSTEKFGRLTSTSGLPTNAGDV